VSSLVRVRAPASTANVGPGFDCAAVALDLWNELEVSESDGAADVDHNHLGIQAFSLLCSPEGKRFAFVDRVPRERGLGSSASVIALGLVAGAAISGRDVEVDELLATGLDLEGHPDNLAAALAGGVCLTWDGRVERVADAPPAVPIALVPEQTVATAEARSALPEHVLHADAAYTAGRAALLGAALASGSADLFAAALDDRLHEPYRATNAPLLADVREHLPAGALGATMSGSGPTIVVWARAGAVGDCVAELVGQYPDVQVLPLSATPKGAHVL
jgi:homoserine kinase